jgi:hypothetical protein
MGESGDAGNKQYRANTGPYLVEEAPRLLVAYDLSVCLPSFLDSICFMLAPIYFLCYFSAIQRSLRAIAVHATMHTR